MASPPAAEGHLLSSGLKKCGYLRKQKHGHRRFFVLREPSVRGPARLEYYESEKKWRNKSAAKRVIALDSCLCVNKRADAKHKHLIALYTKDEYFAVAADSEHERESWYAVLSQLIAEGKASRRPACTSSLVGFEEAQAGYGLPAAPAATYKEVWQVNLKSKGLGQVKNLTGVYRLCLSSRTVGFVKLNAEAAAVSLQLANIRRCGHSDSFFFVEVGRSAVTGPGEFWMQAEDSVVAQNIHETILEAMRAMKELSEFRPRSKSQSAGTKPISVPPRRHLSNLPPSQTGLGRRSRTDGVAATPPGRKPAFCRIRTASEGDGSVTRPASVGGSPPSPSPGGALSSGRTCRMLESSSNLHQSRSVPISSSPPAAPSPVSVSPRGGASARRPFSCSAAIAGSLGDAGFLLCEDFGSSPGEPRFLPLTRSDTPDSLSSTPPSRDAGDPYMLMEGQAYRKRTHSLTTPRQQRAPAPLASASLDDYTLMRMASGRSPHSASPQVCYPEDYGDVEIGSSRSSSSNLGDDGYMPMTPGAASQPGRGDAYVPMSPMCVSAPKQILNPRAAAGGGCRTSPPSLEDSGYMRMWCGSKSAAASPDRQSDYMNMSPGNPPPLQTPPDHHAGLLGGEHGQYVLMSPQSSRQRGGESDYYSVMQAAPPSPSGPSPVRHGRAERGRRPNRLYLDALRTLPSMREHPQPGEPRSPGEYIDIDFPPPSGVSTESRPPGGGGPGWPSLTDYRNLELGSRPPKGAGAPAECRDALPALPTCRPDGGARPQGLGEDAEMAFGMTSSPPQPVPHSAASQSGRERRLPPGDRGVPEGIGAFMLGASSSSAVDPDGVAKVIRAHPQGRRRHSSETFSSTATVTPVFPSFACGAGAGAKRHSSVENVSSRSSEGSDDEDGSPVGRQNGAGYRGGLNYIALNLLDVEKREAPPSFNAASSCKGGVNGLRGTPYVCLGFKEAATTAKD